MTAGAAAAPLPAIVFVHATRLTGAQWAPQVAELSSEFRCFTPDLPGHGTAAATAFTLDAAAAEITRVIELEAGGPALVVGLSLGSYVGLEVAARRPELVRGLVLAGVTVEPGGIRSLPFRGLARLYRSAPEPWLYRQQARSFRRYPAPIRDAILEGGFSFRGGGQAVTSLVGERFRPRLAAYPGPVLLVNGQRDLLFRLGARSFKRVANDAHHVVVPGAGHRSTLDRSEAFSALVRAFATRIEDPAD